MGKSWAAIRTRSPSSHNELKGMLMFGAHVRLAPPSRTMAPTFLQLAIQYSSLALLYYDYTLTFHMEVKYIWGSRIRLSTILYVACRYALPANILYLFAITDKLHASCDTWYKIIGALSVVGRIAIIFVWSGRNYAIYPNNRWILATCGILGITCIILDILHVPGLRCSGSWNNPIGQKFTWAFFHVSSHLHLIASELLSILMVAFEFVSAGMMVFRGIQILKEHRGISHQTSESPLDHLLFEQGMLYFCIVFLLTTASVVLNYCMPGGFLQHLLNAFTLPLSGLLTARFLLHLRRWKSKTWVDPADRAADGSVLSAIIVDFGGEPPQPNECAV
ncbi:hypothetical protein BD779DRAFT_1559498 [Infundibulicybe gibba]|nr:hypothetical protein BD779DRAFT_1559498 [Infundibulicybe gibba]